MSVKRPLPALRYRRAVGASPAGQRLVLARPLGEPRAVQHEGVEQPVAVHVDERDAGAVGLDDEPLLLDAAVDGRPREARVGCDVHQRDRPIRRRLTAASDDQRSATADGRDAQGERARMPRRIIGVRRPAAGRRRRTAPSPRPHARAAAGPARAGSSRICCSGRTPRPAAACLRPWPAAPWRDTPGRGRCRGR